MGAGSAYVESIKTGKKIAVVPDSNVMEEGGAVQFGPVDIAQKIADSNARAVGQNIGDVIEAVTGAERPIGFGRDVLTDERPRGVG